MNHILIVEDKSEYDSVAHFMDEMAACFYAHDIQVSTLNVHSKESVAEIEAKMQQEEYDVIFAMNGVLLDETSKLGKELLRENTIYCTLLMDHPMYFHERLCNPFQRICVFCPDRDHVEYVKEHYENIWHVSFIAHGGCQSVRQIPFEEKSMDISFFGTYINPESVMKEIEDCDTEIASVMKEMCEILRKQPDKTLGKALKMVLEEKDSSKEVFSLLPKMGLVDKYIRAYYRDEVIRTLGEAGLPVDVFGNGWSQFSGIANVHAGVPFVESLELMADSKISLNVMPWFKAGSHDRICTAMLCGSVAVSDSSEYLEDAFLEEHFQRYRLLDMEQLVEDVHDILADIENSQERIDKTKEFAMRNHTWGKRAEDVLAYLWQLEDFVH